MFAVFIVWVTELSICFLEKRKQLAERLCLENWKLILGVVTSGARGYREEKGIGNKQVIRYKILNAWSNEIFILLNLVIICSG